jgi:YVTN family beta-propeller protein
MLIKPAASQGRGVAHFLLFGMTHRFHHRNLRVSLPRPSFDGGGLMLDFLRVMCVAVVAACGGHANAGARNAATHAGNGVNIYANTGANELAPDAARALPMVYVPNSRSGSVTIIDPRTYQVVRTFATGKVPQHVVPAYDLDTLWVANNAGNTLTPIDPRTGKEGNAVRVDDPYNLYFTPDGKYAMVIAEARRRIDFRDPHTMQLLQSLPVKCKGLDHVEFTADNRYAIATCEFSGQVVKIGLATHKVVGYLTLDPASWHNLVAQPIARLFGRKKHRTTGFSALMHVPSMPQDIRSSPDGSKFYVADMKKNGVFVIDPYKFERIDFIPTGIGTHGIFPSRDGRYLYITNRGWTTLAAGRHGPGSISVLDPKTDSVVATWKIPGGGSPDMGNVSADGKELWVSGRYDDEVYVFDTKTGQLTHRIPVGHEPHGLAVWPQPGRYSLGHTGNMR